MRWWLALVVVTCVAVTAEQELPWWKTATFYQVYVRSFKDSNGDGVGDLKGITQNAYHLKEIGVDAIWLSPVFMSPMVDFGYDISDFRAIDPIYGTMDDFKELIAKMKELGIKMLLDMVPNHCSDQHVWFNQSLQKIDPYTNYFVWDDGKIDNTTGQRLPPDNWLAIFNGSTWDWKDERQQFYLHLFTPQQIDFDYRNPLVVKEFDDIMLFWLDLGVDGYRMDAPIYLREGDYNVDEPQLPNTFPVPSHRREDYNNTQTTNQQASYDLMTHWVELVYNYTLKDDRQRVMLMEAYTDDYHTLKFYGENETSFAMPFNFKLQEFVNLKSRAPDVRDLVQNFLASLKGDQTPNWVFGNHDDNYRLADRTGPESVDSWSMFQGMLPGIKVVYYGEEIGMRNTFIRWDQTVDTSAKVFGPDGYTKRDRDPVRTPMQWDDSEPSGGFSSTNSTWLPVNPNYWWLNVAAQKRAENSHFKVFQSVSKIRKDPVLMRGNMSIMAPDNDTLVIIRSYNESSYVFIFNMGSVTRDYTTANFFKLQGLDKHFSVEVVSSNNIANSVKKGMHLQQGSALLRLRQKAAVILRSPPSPSAATRLLIPSVLLILVMVLRLVT